LQISQKNKLNSSSRLASRDGKRKEEMGRGRERKGRYGREGSIVYLSRVPELLVTRLVVWCVSQRRWVGQAVWLAR